MKKFLVVLVGIVVAVCISLTTYYFLRNDEIINFTTKEIYCNVNDIISVNELGLNVKRKNKHTSYNYNAGGEDVTTYVEYQNDGYYLAKKGGVVDVVISTTNKKFPSFTIKVHIGDGSVANPYNLFDEDDLALIGSTYGLDGYYELMKDITLTENFLPIGHIVDQGYKQFKGHFNGNGHVISRLNLTEEDASLTNAGLFSSIGPDAYVTDLVISNANIDGEFATAGALAGEVQGYVSKIRVENSTVASTSADAKVGALVGLVNANSTVEMSYAENTTVTANGVAGGLLGEVQESSVNAVYVNELTLAGEGKLGGLVGRFVVSKNKGTIRQSYAVANSEVANFEAFIGEFATTNDEETTDSKNAKLKYLVGNYAVGSADKLIAYSNDTVKNYIENEVVSEKGLVQIDKGFYLVTATTVNDLKYYTDKEYTYYGYSAEDKVLWSPLIWNYSINELPTLKMSDSEFPGVTSDYLASELDRTPVTNVEDLKEKLDADLEGVRIELTGEEYDFANETLTPHQLINSVIDGKGAVIKNLKIGVSEGNMGLFTKIDNSIVRNIKFVNVSFVNENGQTINNAGTLAGEIVSSVEGSVSSIENVTFDFAEDINLTATNFGAVAGVIDNGTKILNCEIGQTGRLTVVTGAQITNASGVVAVVRSGELTGNMVKATLSGNEKIAGLVAENNGSLDNNQVELIVNYSKDSFEADVAGLVAVNNASLSNSNADVTINVEKTNSALNLAGLVAENNGTVENVTVTGAGILNKDTVTANVLNIGGIAVINNGTIRNAYNNLTRLGTLMTDKDYRSAGAIVTNEGSASQLFVNSSNIEGNTVAGAVVNMNGGNLDQVFVGKLTTVEGVTTIERNNIKGDRYVAGVVYAQGNSTITNVQASSVIEGASNGAKVSLIALIFPDGAVLNKATINSEFAGYADAFYKETWRDANNVTLGEAWGGRSANSYNLYAEDGASGTMKNVVINVTDLAGFNYQSSNITNDWLTGNDMTDTSAEKRSFVKDVNAEAFNNTSSFDGEVVLHGAGSAFNWFGSEYRFTLEFDTVTTLSGNASWYANNGLTLRFVQLYINELA